MKFKKLVLTCIGLIYISQIFGQTENKLHQPTPLSIGEQVEFKSEILNENRVLNIYLPVRYNKNALQTYPVIYLLDGSMDEDFIHISGLVQYGSFSWVNMIPESIVVGISNIDRKKDLTFITHTKKDKEDFPTSGKSEAFMHFIEKELHPFIDENYKTNSIKTLIGQSFGALFATEILFKKPYLFNNYIIVSPSLWWDNESLLKYTPTLYTSEKSIYIAVGKEGAVMERVAQELSDTLKREKNGNTHIYFDFLEKQNHGDALHLAVYNAFESIFKKEEK